jgi:hypothetical protein
VYLYNKLPFADADLKRIHASYRVTHHTRSSHRTGWPATQTIY